MTRRCGWLNDPEIGRWFLPGCMGGAVYGESQCTCGARRTRQDSMDDLRDRLDALEDEVERLKADGARRQDGRLRDDN